MIDSNERERKRAKEQYTEDQRKLDKQLKDKYEEQMRIVQTKSEEVVRDEGFGGPDAIKW